MTILFGNNLLNKDVNSLSVTETEDDQSMNNLTLAGDVHCDQAVEEVAGPGEDARVMSEGSRK